MEMQEEIEDVVTNLAGAYMSNIEDVLKKTKLRTDEDPGAPLASSMHDILSIHFSLQERTRDDLVHYSGLVTEDLLTRELSASGNLQEPHDCLRESFVIEFTYWHLKGAIAHGSLGKENALFHLIDAVPCILHMENRIGLKFITMLAIKGLGNAKRASTFSQERSEGKRIGKLFE